MHDYQLGTLAGLRLTARPSAIFGILGLWALLGGLGYVLLDLPIATALGAGLAAAALHVGSEVFHQLGHAWAARRTGYPMIGVQLWGIFAASIYPAAEPPLPPATHIRRALGGPLASLLLTLAAGAVTLLLPEGVGRWIALFWFVDNLFVFTLQAALPLGFNDGATIWHWWNVQRKGLRQ